MRGSTTPSKSTSSQGVHAHDPLLTIQPSLPFRGQPPFVTMLRELTFGPPPNEATALISTSYANPFPVARPRNRPFESGTCSSLLFIKRQPARRLWSPCCILSMRGDHRKSQRLQARSPAFLSQECEILRFGFCVVSIGGYASKRCGAQTESSRRLIDCNQMVNLIIPDKWQQDAVNLLREGKDVVVQAPTGAGKTYIFELMYEALRGQAVYTVPTRALANDKLAEWRARGWDVGISTGDVAENLGARVVVATLETQKSRFLRREGPRLLVVDEYQLLADPVRGMNYELILSLAPAETQILLLSGSVANPEDVVAWLQRIGRTVALIEHHERPVRLEEVMLNDMPVQIPSVINGHWPRLISGHYSPISGRC